MSRRIYFQLYHKKKSLIQYIFDDIYGIYPIDKYFNFNVESFDVVWQAFEGFIKLNFSKQDLCCFYRWKIQDILQTQLDILFIIWRTFLLFDIDVILIYSYDNWEKTGNKCTNLLKILLISM